MKGSFRKRGCTCPDKKKCKCDATWSFSLDIGRDELTGKRKQKTVSGFRTKKEAEKACAEMISQIENDNYREPSKMLFKDYLKQWLESKSTTIKKNTYENYVRHVDNNIIPHIGNLPLSKITPLDISNLHVHLLKEKGLSESTVGDVHKVLKSSLEQALAWDYVTKNVATNVKKPKIEKKEIKVWDADQSNAFLKVAKTNRSYIAFLLALTTGMRQGEILGLRWKDVNFEEGTIQVVQTLSHDGKELSAGAKTQTGNRVIRIDETTIKELREHKKTIAADKLAAVEYKSLDLVIPTSVGTPMTPRNLMRTFYNLLEKSKLPKIKFHDLRHTHATLLLKNGEHPKVVSERLGHADTRTTMDIYSHVLPTLQKDAADRFGKMFFA
jgi:integrase